MRPGHRTLLALAASLLWGAAVVPARAADRALLVGIDTYEDPRVPATPGATDDARAIAAVLHDRFGFADSSIHLLLDEQATAQGVIDAFRTWLIEGTEPGDRVFFLYAGHGSQLPDDNGDEADGFDETLAPHDVDPEGSGAGQIRDDVLSGLVAALSGRRAVLLFDSCHSGTVTRGLPAPGAQASGVRFLPRADQLRRLWGAGDGESQRGGPVDWTVEPSGAGDEDARVVDRLDPSGRLAGIVILSAARPGQLAYPLEVEGHERGALSYLFEQIYRPGGSRGFFKSLLGTAAGAAVGEVSHGAGNVVASAIGGKSVSGTAQGAAQDVAETVTVAALGQALDTGMARLQSDGQLPGDQQPELEVISAQPIADQALFGDWQEEPAVALTNPVTERHISLETVNGRSAFESGESIVLRVTVDRPGYLYLLVFSENREATCIFPNPDDPDARVAAGTRRLPPDDSYVFPVTSPYGRDVVVALVSDRALPLCETVRTTWDAVYDVVDLRAVQEAHRARISEQRGIGFQSLDRHDAGAGGAPDWQSATLVLETRPAAP